jgi:hypothetical protein
MVAPFVVQTGSRLGELIFVARAPYVFLAKAFDLDEYGSPGRPLSSTEGALTSRYVA